MANVQMGISMNRTDIRQNDEVHTVPSNHGYTKHFSQEALLGAEIDGIYA